jgi:predicted transposase/invertase (TIGR01784 family)
MAYEAREAELMDQRTRVRSALQKGKAEGKAEIIHALLRSGMGVNEIASMTGMEMKEVEQIQKGILSSLADTK